MRIPVYKEYEGWNIGHVKCLKCNRIDTIMWGDMITEYANTGINITDACSYCTRPTLDDLRVERDSIYTYDLSAIEERLMSVMSTSGEEIHV